MQLLQIRLREKSHRTFNTVFLNYLRNKMGGGVVSVNTQANERRQLSLHRSYLVQNDVSYFKHTLSKIVQVNGKGVTISLAVYGTFKKHLTKFKN